MLARLLLPGRWFLAFLLGTVGLLSSHWASETLYHWMTHGPGHDPSWGVGGGAIVVFLACPIALFALRSAFTRPETRVPHDAEPPRLPVLVWFLSDPGKDTTDGVPPWFQPSGDLDVDLARLTELKAEKKLWNWEMLLRAARHHAGRLRAVVVVPSRETAPLAHGVGRLLARYEPFKAVRVLVSARRPDGEAALIPVPPDGLREDQGWEFEHFEELTRAVLGAVDHLNRTGVPDDPELPRVADRGIMVDFTGGQKVTSVVAATATFNRPIRAEYVSTHPPYPVRGFDLVLASPTPAGPGH